MAAYPALHTKLDSIRTMADLAPYSEEGVNAKNRDGLTPLQVAAAKGYAVAIPLLIQKGAEICYEGENGPSSLRLALDNGHKETAATLLIYGVVPREIPLTDGEIAVLLPKKISFPHRTMTLKGYLEMSRKEEWPPLLVACSYGESPEVVEYFLEQGASPHTVCRKIHSVSEAAEHCSAIVLEILLEAGADPNMLGCEGIPPLHLTLRGKNAAGKLRLLLEAGADVDAKDKDGAKAIHDAAWYANIPAIRELLYHSASGKDVNIDEIKAYHAMNEIGAEKTNRVLRLLVANGARPHSLFTEFPGDLFQRDLIDAWEDNTSPLHFAIGEGSEAPIIRQLLEWGAELHRVDEVGEKPIDTAYRDDDPELTSLYEHLKNLDRSPEEHTLGLFSVCEILAFGTPAP